MIRRFFSSKPSKQKTPLPLEGLRVLEMGQLIAGPFAGCILGYFGAEVIKIEPPVTGDALRNWRILDEGGTSYWWRSMGRNKKCITVNLKKQRGRDIVHSLILKSDVVLENFRPGTMEKYGMGPDKYLDSHPELIYTRVSGYGQTGPKKDLPGFASACEGYGGFRYLNGYPNEAPVRPNLSIGDTLAAMNAVIGTLVALQAKKVNNGLGQVVDVSIYESVFGMLEGVVPEFDGAGVIREPSGTTVTGIAPTNTYKCSDDVHIVIGGNGDSIFKRLCAAMNRNDLGNDERLIDNAGRVKHQQEVDDAIRLWTNSLPSAKILDMLDEAGVPNGPINSIKDIMEDEHFIARGMFEEVDLDKEEYHVDGMHKKRVTAKKKIKISAMVPKLNGTPGMTKYCGKKLGHHNIDVLENLLGFTENERLQLEKDGVI
jgi:crotonobetainyl-CoA:carnitine CoA-transferase CaiB-like acyl-CoA transferase